MEKEVGEGEVSKSLFAPVAKFVGNKAADKPSA